MQINLWGLVQIVIALIVGAAGMYIWMRIKSQKQRIHELEEILAGKRHTENTIAALEDIGLLQTGAVYRIQAAIQQNQDTLEFLEFAAAKTARAAGIARKSPREYPVDAPSGSRRKPSGTSANPPPG